MRPGNGPDSELTVSGMDSRHDTRRVDVLIVGAGLPGLALAVALKQALGTSFDVMAVDPALTPEGRARRWRDPRALAIVAAARRLLETIGVWERFAENPSRSSTWW